MTKDYYKILDIPEFSTQDEIKSAYRRLARKLHPDVAGNTDDAILKFKEINEAYEVLSNASKKADYDSARKFYNWGKGKNSASGKEAGNATNPNTNVKPENKREGCCSNKKEQKKSGFSFNWDDFIKNTCLNAKNKESKQPKRGENIYAEIEITIFEAINGATKVVNMLQTYVCPKCEGRKFVNGNKCTCCDGKGEKTEYKRFTVKIPAGIKNKSKIRLAGEGENGINGGQRGDLYITVNIKEPQNYKTEGLNILKNVEIAPYEAILGTNITIPTMQGNVSVTIAPYTKNGQKIRLKGCGINSGSKTGDMIVSISIQIPEKLSNEEIELYKRLQSLSSSKLH